MCITNNLTCVDDDVLLEEIEFKTPFNIRSNDKVKEVVASSCTHYGPHGSEYHTSDYGAEGWCYWCYICNPSNEDAY